MNVKNSKKDSLGAAKESFKTYLLAILEVYHKRNSLY